MLRIKALGGFTVCRGEDRVLGAAAQPRRIAVLAMVARAGSRGISRDRLLATLWPDADDEQGRNALKQAIYALRRDLDLRELFLGTRELRLNPDEVACDIAEFEERLRQDDHERAVAVYDGPFLDGFRLASVPEFEQWVEEERRALGRALANGLERLARTALERGEPLSAVRWHHRLAALEPLNARFTVGLMNALLAAGDRPGALQQARIYEELIAQELDLPPDESVLELARRIREGRVAPAAAVALSPEGAVGAVVEEPASPSLDAAARPSVPAAAAVAAAIALEPTPVTGPPSPPPAVPPPAPPDLSVVVLPFTPLSDDTDAGYLCDGLTEEVIHALSRVHGLRVPGRMSTTGWAGGGMGLTELGARLGVATALEGSVRSGAGEVRVTARLLRTRDGATLWSGRYQRPADNVLAAEEEISRAIALGIDAALREAAGLPQSLSPSERASALYALGLGAWTPKGAGLGQGLEHFRQAIAIDPRHAHAHAALADAYGQLAFYGFLPAPRAATLADEESGEAMRLAPDLAEANAARGSSLLWVQRDFTAGTAALARATELDPSLVMAQYRLAYVRLCLEGAVESGLAVAERAATMPGATGHSRVMYGQQLLAARRYDEAIDALHGAIDIEAPSFLAYHWLSVTYAQQGKGAEALAAAVAEASLSDRHPWALQSLVVACRLAGQVRRAETLLATLKARAVTGHVQGSVLALAHMAMGDIDAAMAFLERAVEDHDPSVMMLRVFPMFDPFREHPRFPALLRAAGWRASQSGATA